jgi:hypothetical protein
MKNRETLPLAPEPPEVWKKTTKKRWKRLQCSRRLGRHENDASHGCMSFDLLFFFFFLFSL